MVHSSRNFFWCGQQHGDTCWEWILVRNCFNSQVAPLSAIAPTIDNSRKCFSSRSIPLASSSFGEALAVGDGPILYAFLILLMSDTSDKLSSLKGTIVPSTAVSKWLVIVSRVISGLTEALITRRFLVRSEIPNLRKLSPICAKCQYKAPPSLS